jgi:tRNA-specific 2-thiouridylase
VPVSRAEAKVRYRSPTAPATVSATGGGFRLDLDMPAYGVAPGQAAVLYDDGAVVGAGTIVAGAAATENGRSTFETEGE